MIPRKTEEIVFDSDYKGLSCSKEVQKVLNDEKLYFSDEVSKKNKFGIKQTRILVLSNEAFYNFTRKLVLKRRCEFKKILGVTVGLNDDPGFVIHGQDIEHDYYYLSYKKKEIIKILSDAYLRNTNKLLTICQSKNRSLSQFVTTKREKKKRPEVTKMDLLLQIDINKFLEVNRRFTIPENLLMNKGKMVTLDDFDIIKVVGRGTFGKVCCVEYKPTHEIYAMKSIKKDILIEQEQIENTLLEKEILKSIDHPFLCRLEFCFQNNERIFLVMPFVNGGELFQHLRKYRTFNEDKTVFYCAQIGLALQYLHDKGIVYRDLKPENILMDELGYLKLTDFGMAKKLKGKEKATSFCGTPEYLAPEIITGEGHDKNADWWSFGILIYEMLYGIPPFYDENAEKMYELIRSGDLKFPNKNNVSADAKSIITRLLDKRPTFRFGSKKGMNEIKEHPFFKNIDFDLLLEKKLKAPFIPQIENKEDVKYFDQEFTREDVAMTYIPKKNVDIINANQNKFSNFSE